ncbi:membrane-associated transporter protein [Biomphalaria pfeifferi]|uniref:Membrane-associated transporter protein n=1 Tax=Biomphalaria pfeifferi TaxID=112525 RepID=A0AAD8BCE3_BIOPF|nr:membrane-associated transporter protein [Biomphalaria pfeifferi]
MTYGSVSFTQASQAAESEVYQLRPWHFLIICAALFAQEVAITNELIYMVTWEKLLGVPLEFVSLPGVISATISFFSIPVMGRFGDKGNRLRRKSLLVIGSGCCLFFGSCCMFVGCLIKWLGIHSNENRLSNLPAWNRTCQNQNVKSNITSFNETDCLMLSDSENMIQHDPLSRLTSVLAVATFVFIDYGFDTGSPNIRSYMLECVHKSQHSKVLSVGVIMSGLGGFVVSLIGLFDFNFTVEQDVDPNIVKALALCFFLMISVLITFSITLIYGRNLFHKYNTQTTKGDERNKCGKCHNGNNSETQSVNQSTHEQVNHNETNGNVNYSKCADSVLQKIQNENVDISERQAFKSVQSNTHIDIENKMNIVDKHDETKIQWSSCNDDEHQISCSIPNYLPESNSVYVDNSLDTTIKKCFRQISFRVSQFFAGCITQLKTPWRSNKVYFIFLSCLLAFFASGTNISFELYFTNFLSEGVYQGKGDAPQQDEAKQRYDSGMRTAAIGTFVFQSIFLLYNAAHQKISSETALVYEFMIVSLLLVPSLLAFVLTKTLVSFYVTIIVNGAFRTLVFTTPYILAAETMRMDDDGQGEHEATINNSLSSSKGSDNSYGSVISSVGSTVPLHYLLLSTFMGPLLKATQDSASPLIYTISMAIVTVGVCFSMLVSRYRYQRAKPSILG